MNGLLIAVSLATAFAVTVFLPGVGANGVLVCGALAFVAGVFVSRIEVGGRFLLQIFMGALLARVFVGTAIYAFELQDFFGGDAHTYDVLGQFALQSWRDGVANPLVETSVGWGMSYMVAGIYYLIGRNMLAVQYVNAVIGAATAPVIYLCAHQVFGNERVSRIAAYFVAFYPSLVLWSSQGLKDGPIVFLLAVSILATLRLGERVRLKYIAVLALAALGIMSLRFYVFFMLAAAVGGAFVIGMSRLTAQSLTRQVVVIVALGLAMTQLGVLGTASDRLEQMNLENVQVMRADLAQSAQSGFGQDVDVSTTGGAITTIPVGMVYLLFAPFPWQLASLRQSITLPEMVVWWASFPLLVLGLWYTARHRMRRALPILIFTTMLTLAYSVFQGNVGTAYRQRSQLLVFYFIFVAVGYELWRERAADRKLAAAANRRQVAEAAARASARRKQQREWEKVAEGLTEKVGF